MEKIIYNYLNYIQNICIIRKRLHFYSRKPCKQRISQMISDICAQSQWRRKVIGKKLEVVYVFIAKLHRKFLRNQLNYQQKLFIIKKIVGFPPLETAQMEEFSSDFSVIPNHFDDELQKLGENSSICVVSGNKTIFCS